MRGDRNSTVNAEQPTMSGNKHNQVLMRVHGLIREEVIRLFYRERGIAAILQYVFYVRSVFSVDVDINMRNGYPSRL